MASGNRLEAELGYGLPVGSRLVGTPRFGIGTSEHGRDYRLGYGLTMFESGAMSFELGIEGTRREKGQGVQVVVIGADHTATRRSKAALRSWSNGASEQGVQKAEGPTQDDPAVKAEMQQIEDVMRRGDRAGLSKYGGFQGATMRLIELRKLPQSKGATGVSIDSYETWVSRRLRMLDAEL